MHRRTYHIVYTGIFAVLLAICSWISIPTMIPFTLQTFAAFLALTTLGGRRGLYAVAVYLLLGAVGLPVFSGGQGGIGVLLGTTGGYIVGFLVSALVYWLVTAKLGDSLPVTVSACVLGMMVCYGFGTAWFMAAYARTSGPVGLTAALGWCVIPFIVPDLCKMALAIALSRRMKKYLK